MHKGIGLVLLAGLVSTQVSAEDMTATDKLINTQTTRFNQAYETYVNACINLDKKEQGDYSLFGKLSPDCRNAKEHYKLQADILVRLLHGDNTPSPLAAD